MASAGAQQARPGGRHLLRSKRLAAEIVREANVARDDLVIDVGAGSGMLTSALCRTGARVVAIEPDRRLARRLRRECPSAHVVEQDALQTAWPGEPFRVVANLPFALAADICRSLFTDPDVQLVSADLIVEWDFAAKRSRLWPSTALSVVWGAWYELGVVRRLEPEAFVPRPSVAAGVLRAVRRPAPLIEPRDARAYEQFVRRGFRRGQQARLLDAYGWARRWEESSARGRTVPSMTRRGRAR